MKTSPRSCHRTLLTPPDRAPGASHYPPTAVLKLLESWGGVDKKVDKVVDATASVGTAPAIQSAIIVGATAIAPPAIGSGRALRRVGARRK
jgi:hypothetical protein